MELEKLGNLIEMPISSQAFSKDGWKLIKKFKNEKNNYYALIVCEHCGYEKVVNYYNFIDKTKKQRECIRCKYERQALSEIGNVYGCTKIISIDSLEVIPRSDGKGYKANIYFNTECTNCGKKSIKLFNKNNWKKYDRCNKCEASFENSFENHVKNDYKCGAKQRSVHWNLSDSKFLELIYGNCFYCGQPPQERISGGKIGFVNGIDRIDSNKDYQEDNCVSCCSMCNLMKNNYTVPDFKEHIFKIYNHLIKEGSTTIS